MAVDFLRDADAAGLGQRFQPRRDVDPVAVDVAVLGDDVAQIEADPENEAAFLGLTRFVLGQLVLPGHRAGEPVDRACKLDQQTVAEQLDHPSVVFRDQWLEKFLAERGEAPQRALLVRRHQPAVADDVGSQYCGKASFQCPSSFGRKDIGQSPPRNRSTVPQGWVLRAGSVGGVTA